MKNVTKNSQVLATLLQASPQSRRLITKNCSPAVINTLCEIAHNCLRGNIKNVDLNKIRKHKHAIRKLASCCIKSNKGHGYEIKTTKARKLLTQRGGFLPLLPLLFALGPIVAKAAVGGLVATGVGAITKKIVG